MSKSTENTVKEGKLPETISRHVFHTPDLTGLTEIRSLFRINHHHLTYLLHTKKHIKWSMVTNHLHVKALCMLRSCNVLTAITTTMKKLRRYH